MTAAFFAWTDAGRALKSRLQADFTAKGGASLSEIDGEPSAEKTARAFRDADALIFIGASGIAVRLIAPHLVSKQTDPAVLVIDEKARWVVPLAGGHLGGANRLAREIAGQLQTAYLPLTCGLSIINW